MVKIHGFEEVEAIDQAIIGTEKEIAGNAWDIEDTDAIDDTGNRALEAIGEGLEGQLEDEDEVEGDDAETDAEAEGEEGETDGEGETEGTTVSPAQARREQPEGRVPSVKHREVAERARQAEAERDQLRQQLEQARGANPEIEALKTQVSTLTQLLQGKQQPPAQTQVEQTQPKKAPDIFEDPQGFTDYITQQVQSAVGSVRTDLRQTAVATSFELAHIRHQDAFPKAMDAINRLDPNSPEDRAVVQRIYASPNPGEALVSWHRRNETLQRVGNDPAAYEERIRQETRQALLNDPEFKKQLLADMRGEALRGDDGQPRTTTRLPKSLSRAGGSNLGVTRSDPRGGDDSDQAIAESAWR